MENREAWWLFFVREVGEGGRGPWWLAICIVKSSLKISMEVWLALDFAATVPPLNCSQPIVNGQPTYRHVTYGRARKNAWIATEDSARSLKIRPVEHKLGFLIKAWFVTILCYSRHGLFNKPWLKCCSLLHWLKAVVKLKPACPYKMLNCWGKYMILKQALYSRTQYELFVACYEYL